MNSFDDLSEAQYRLQELFKKIAPLIEHFNNMQKVLKNLHEKGLITIHEDGSFTINDTVIKGHEKEKLKDLSLLKNEDDTKNFSQESLSPTFNGKATEALARIRTIGQVDTFSRKVTVNGVDIYSPTGAKNIGVGAAKIFRYALAAFTKLNHQNTPSEKLKDGVRLFLDLNDYAQANGVDISSDTARRNFRRKIRNDLEKLRQAGATLTEKIKGKPAMYAGLNYIGYYEVKGDSIMIEFTLKMAEYLVSLPIINYPRSLYNLEDRDYNAFAIGEALANHYSIDNNVLRGTEGKLRVETLLKYTSFPSLEELQAHKWSWERYVKTPFEKCLDRLYQIGFIKDYCYCFAGGQELTDEEARAIIDKDYGYFVSLLVKFELNGYEDSTKRAKAIAEKRADKMKKLQAKRKKKTNTDNN